MQLHVIDTGFFKLDGGAMYGVVPKSIWSKRHAPDENNLCTWAMRCLLVEAQGRLILIDNGLGNKQDQKFFGHYQPHGAATLEGSLKKLGFNTDDITDVFLTHLHFDHCGGSIVRNSSGDLVPAFANAIYWSNEYHWHWATEPNAREKASFLPENILPIEQSGQLKFVDIGRRSNEENVYVKEVFPNFDVLLVNGHTDAMMIPHIRYKGRTLVYMADLLPSVHHIPLPWVMAYDTRPLLTMDEKKDVLQTAADQEMILFLEHDPLNECALVQRSEKGVTLKGTFPLAEV